MTASRASSRPSTRARARSLPTLPGDAAIRRSRACEPTPALRDASGEIPDEEPYLLRQILDARALLPNTAIDLVVVDMGINDTEIFNLVLPGKSLAAVVERVRSLAPRVRYALEKLGSTFPGARVLVTGYYPLVSKESDLSEVFQFANAVVDAALEEDVRVPLLDRAFRYPVLRKIEHDVAALFSSGPREPLGRLGSRDEHRPPGCGGLVRSRPLRGGLRRPRLPTAARHLRVGYVALAVRWR